MKPKLSLPLLSLWSSKYMEKQIQAKTVLHQTKQKLFKETAQRSSIIQKLEKEVISLDITGCRTAQGGFPHNTRNLLVFFR